MWWFMFGVVVGLVVGVCVVLFVGALLMLSDAEIQESADRTIPRRISKALNVSLPTAAIVAGNLQQAGLTVHTRKGANIEDLYRTNDDQKINRAA